MANKEIMNPAYDENGMPVNLEIYKGDFIVCGIMAFFTSTPDTKYFDEETWIIHLDEHRFGAYLGDTENAKGWSRNGTRTPFSELTKDAQAFVLRYYEDTFGLPSEAMEG